MAVLLVFLFGDPHTLEGPETGEDGSADPGRKFFFRGRGVRNELDFLRVRDHLDELLVNSGLESGDSSVSAAQDNVLEELLADVDVAGVDGVENHVLDALEVVELRDLEGDGLEVLGLDFAVELEVQNLGAVGLVEVDLGAVREFAVEGLLVGDLSLGLLVELAEALLDVPDEVSHEELAQGGCCCRARPGDLELRDDFFPGAPLDVLLHDLGDSFAAEVEFLDIFLEREPLEHGARCGYLRAGV